MSLPARTAALLLSASLPLSAIAATPTLDERVNAWAKTQGSGAVVVAEKVDGTWRYALGGKPFDDDAKVAPEDVVFEIGSISKVFTGLLLAHAVQEGKLALDDTLADRLPVDFASAHTGAITLAQLATHTSCLPRLPDNLSKGVDEHDPYAHYDDDRLFDYLAKADIGKASPCRSAYSNLGMGVLGVVLERAYDTPWATLVAEKITVPLKMPATAQTLDTALEKRFAAGHAGSQSAAPWTFRSMAAAGALRSSASDMSRFADALLAGADGPLAPVWSTFVGPHADAPDIDGRVGLGLFASPLGGQPALWHNGGTGGFRSDLRVFPASGRGYVLLASNDQANPDAWLAALQSDGTPATNAADAPAIALDAGALDAYIGVYPMSPDARVTIVRVGDGLRARLTGQTFLTLKPAATDRFAFDAVDAQLSFSRAADGTIDAVTLHQNGRTTRMPRETATPPTVLFPSADALAEFDGIYDFSAFQPGATLIVRAVDDVLTAQLTGQSALPVHNTAADRFEWDVVPAALTFERDANGTIVAATLHQNGAQMRMPRTADN